MVFQPATVCAAEASIHLTDDAQEQAQTLYPFATLQQEAQFKHLLAELRCLVCQNQDLADSHAPLAKDLRDQIYDMVQAGKSDQEITGYLADRYGDFILFKPPVKPLTYVLWLGPLLFLLSGGFIFLRTCQRSGRRHGI
ncbi:MAG: cytochrome c-type biogenesis protein CcmH [Legionellaceae bacterium]|nr:cytochrome c-type biogenesis protein CcmH [Legionellaceae bacterium]